MWGDEGGGARGRLPLFSMARVIHVLLEPQYIERFLG
jgi:hypothetical protein